MDFEGWCDNSPMSRFCQEARLRVRYAETDQMGVAYYANYLIWMEVGRVEYCKALGFRYRDMETDDGILLAVVEARCRYLHPAHYDDEVIVKTWIEEATRRMVRFGYEMSEAGGGPQTGQRGNQAPLLHPPVETRPPPREVPPAVRNRLRQGFVLPALRRTSSAWPILPAAATSQIP